MDLAKPFLHLEKEYFFPSLVGKGYERALTDLFGHKKATLSNMQVIYEGEDYFVGELAKELRSASRMFERERFSHVYTHILLNVAIQAVTDTSIRNVQLATGLPLDFYHAQAKEFQHSITGIQPKLEWKTGHFSDISRAIHIEQALVFPQGASAVFSALINHEGSFAYPHLMREGAVIALIDVGFRTTDFVVVEMQAGGSFAPIARLSGTVDEGVINLHLDIRRAFKAETGGALFESYFQPSFDHRLMTIHKSQFANAIGYLRLGKALFSQKTARNMM